MTPALHDGNVVKGDAIVVERGAEDDFELRLADETHLRLAPTTCGTHLSRPLRPTERLRETGEDAANNGNNLCKNRSTYLDIMYLYVLVYKKFLDHNSSSLCGQKENSRTELRWDIKEYDSGNLQSGIQINIEFNGCTMPEHGIFRRTTAKY